MPGRVPPLAAQAAALKGLGGQPPARRSSRRRHACVAAPLTSRRACCRRQQTLLLTGTPLQNSMRELHALLSYLFPDVFTTCQPFDDAFNLTTHKVSGLGRSRAQQLHQSVMDSAAASGLSRRNWEAPPGSSPVMAPYHTNKIDIFFPLRCCHPRQVDAAQLEAAHHMLRPFCLRRLKQEVELGMPPLVETRIHCPLSAMQTFWVGGWDGWVGGWTGGCGAAANSWHCISAISPFAALSLPFRCSGACP